MNELSQQLGLTPDQIASERFLVTGSEGCIGAWTVRNLALAGCSVVATDVSPAGSRLGKILSEEDAQKVTHERIDLRHDGAIAEVAEAHQVTRIIHLAALQVPFVYANPLLGAEVNVVGTVRVLEAARAASGRIRGLSYASSAASIGPASAPHEPETLYGVLKLSNEHTARIYDRDYGVPSIGLRPCIVYGPTRDQGLTSALTTALKAVTLGLPYTIPFGGLVDLQFAQDVASAFIRSAMAERGGTTAVYDLHGDAVTVEDFVDVIVAIVPEAKGLLTIEPVPIPGNVIVDDTELIERVGELPKTSLRNGIQKSLDIFARHRDGGLLMPADVVGGK